jgi:hypothetical protein
LENSVTYITKLLTVNRLTAKPKPARDFTINFAETIAAKGFYEYPNPESLASSVTQ